MMNYFKNFFVGVQTNVKRLARRFVKSKRNYMVTSGMEIWIDEADGIAWDAVDPVSVRKRNAWPVIKLGSSLPPNVSAPKAKSNSASTLITV